MITEEFTKLRQSKICKLTYNGELLGYRAVVYNLNTRQYMYIDFSVDQFADMPKQAIDKISDFLNTNFSTFEELPLVDTTVNGEALLATKEEIEGNVKITEIEDCKVIYNYITRIIKIHS